MPTLDELRELVAAQLGVNEEDVKPSSSFTDDLGADSLDLVQLMIELEGKFSIEIPDEDAEKLLTVQDVINYLRGKGIEAA